MSVYVHTLALIVLLWLRLRRRKRRVRSMWVRPIFQRRLDRSEMVLISEMRALDDKKHFEYFRMSRRRFDVLLLRVTPFLPKRKVYRSIIRPNISPIEALALTLRFLATGGSLRTLSFSFRCAPSTVLKVVLETSDVIWNALLNDFLNSPKKPDDWCKVSEEFNRVWNFPHCIGAMDGKHVVIQCPENSGSTFFNYKGTFSLNIMAVCDAHYRFLLLDVGAEGRQSDGSVFSRSAFGQALNDGTLHLPPSKPISNSSSMVSLPYCFVADEAFPLKMNIMRPYPGRGLTEDKKVFNYRLSRSRRTIENAFGILVSRWRILRQPIIADPDHAVKYVKAAVALHNYLRVTESAVYCPAGFADHEEAQGSVIRGDWRRDGLGSGLQSIGRTGANTAPVAAKQVRDSFKDYFISEEGQLSWQPSHVRSTGPTPNALD